MSAGGNALVIGGSIAGQLAAAALARAGLAVTILDRDRLPEAALPRKGLPQSRHVHALMVSGQRSLEALLPGITGALTGSGALLLNWTRDIAAHSLGGWHLPFASELMSCFMSRDLLDREVRRAVAAVPAIRTLDGHEAVGLVGGTGAVTGVACRVRGERDSAGTLAADLVVDASGRDSRAPDWLGAVGYGAVGESTVDAFLGYATRVYRPRPDFDADWRGLLARSRGTMTRAGGIMPIEGGRWLVTLAGFSRDYPPQDEAGFLAFARSIGVPEFHTALEAAEPLGPATGYRRTTNRWRRYHEAARWPDGFVAMGDAVCAFNPYYGQGMSVAALSAIALGEMVAERGPGRGFAVAFQRRLGRLLAAPWLMATTEECRYPATEGAVRTWQTRLNLWYTDRLIERATHDPAAMDAFVSVSHLLKPFGTVLRPRVLLPALVHPRARRATPPPRMRAVAPAATFV